MVLLRVRAHEGAAVLSAAISVMRRSDGASAHTHTPSSSSSGFAGARCSGASLRTPSRTR
eukprot:6234774-Prymnesium_polylepis.1